MLFYVLFCLWMASQVQGVLLLASFASVPPLLEDSPPLFTFESLSFELKFSGQWLFSCLGFSVIPSLLCLAPPFWDGCLLLSLFLWALIELNACHVHEPFDWPCPYLPFATQHHEIYIQLPSNHRKRRRQRHKAKAHFHWIYCRKLPFHAAICCDRRAAAKGYLITPTCPYTLRRWRRRRNLKS